VNPLQNNHFERAANLLEASTAVPTLAYVANVQSTLSLSFEQRTANLIALLDKEVIPISTRLLLVPAIMERLDLAVDS